MAFCGYGLDTWHPSWPACGVKVILKSKGLVPLSMRVQILWNKIPKDIKDHL